VDLEVNASWDAERIPNRPGIYAIVNGVTGERYVGQTNDLRKRAQSHLRALLGGTHETNQDRVLQKAWDDFGADAFTFVILEEVSDNSGMPGYDYHVRPDNLSLAEHYYIDERAEYNVDSRIVRGEFAHLIDARAWRKPTPPYPRSEEGPEEAVQPKARPARPMRSAQGGCGVFAIVNRTNGDRYVGGSVDIDAQARTYLRQLNDQRSRLSLLQAAWNVYGAEAFEVVVLELVRDNRRDEGFNYDKRPDNLSLARQYYLSERSEYNKDKAIVARRHHGLIRRMAWRDGV
jgi:hypothetical protein